MHSLMLYGFCFAAVAFGIALVLQKNAVHGAVSLLFCMLMLAGSYALLGAHLVAALQVLVYAGAIVILIVYIIMLLDVRSEDAQRTWRKEWLWAAPVLLLFTVLLGRGLLPVLGDGGGGQGNSDETARQAEQGAGHAAAGAPGRRGVVTAPVCSGPDCERACSDRKDDDGDGMTDCGDTDCGADDACFGTVEAVGAQLLGPYVLPFEVSSVLLLAGIVGAVLLTGRRPKESDAAPSVKEPA